MEGCGVFVVVVVVVVVVIAVVVVNDVDWGGFKGEGDGKEVPW